MKDATINMLKSVFYCKLFYCMFVKPQSQVASPVLMIQLAQNTPQFYTREIVQGFNPVWGLKVPIH